MVHWPGDQPFQRTVDKDLAKGDVCTLSQMTLSVHTGTHMDAPLHFVPDSPTIDELPLDATVGAARVIGIRDRSVITRNELMQHGIEVGERVLFKTANSDRLWSSDTFEEDFVYIDQDAAAYLVECGVRMVGIDYLSVGGFSKDGPETHRELLGAGVWVIEGLNLSGVDPGDYELICLPLRLMEAEGSPARAILRPIEVAQ